ncbi:bacillithiol biosynthesis deacetylase BshB1 [Adhaeribacter radiodurans]|uniref:Bacillithiol biosynthesis deacetylase BshB1 n=1 Tax=Adhaeribacter radiodurans TaxID=2745197 RepID=A0A7L7L6L0_9BACT|nr:bacillithiol biosynthesis deacetylase BshB1 [Adhaeribacter radiodurans]QMU28413.1 bacillithiol biosynthesis deacetylase BshB1 [Adhaeribacter radiodurans]
MKLDILAFSSHPDDIELSCAGTIISHVKAGKKVGIVDLTKGELGTRGTPAIREAEAAAATTIMGLHVRENLGFADGFFRNDREHQLEVVKMLRRYQPEIVIANAVTDRHPDHGRGSILVSEACFLAGLKQIQTEDENTTQVAWRPKAVYHYIQDRLLVPDFVVDITPYWNIKLEAIKAFKSQFYDPTNSEPNTYISNPDFLDFIEARSREMGHLIGTTYGEGFTKERHLGVRSLFDLI